MTAEVANVVVVGGGVIGTAITAQLAARFDNVFLIEAKPRLGLGSSTRNSGVIHAGIYYAKDSLKAFHCVRGRHLLYEFCAKHDIPHRRCGKLIVTDSAEQLPELEKLRVKGEANGVENLEIVDRKFIRKIEPEIESPFALNSPETGIIDAERLVAVLANLARERGAYILPGTALRSASVSNGQVDLSTSHEEVRSRFVINAAGLYADEVARMFGYSEHRIHPCRGEYVEVIPSRSNLVNNLVYPLPLPTLHGLGVHLTKTVAGALLIGPNAKYVSSKENYEDGRSEVREFFESARGMLPALRYDDLRLSYSGLRPRLAAENDHTFKDFVIRYDPQHPMVVHLIGMESPGLTGCLSIAQSVAAMVEI
jgi:L-2-hydroxyglutarate oxidase LhgO